MQSLLSDIGEFHRAEALKLITVFSACTFYAVVRYNVFGTVELSNIALFIMNKAVSICAVACMLVSAIAYSINNADRVWFWGKASLHLALLHVVMSLAILSSDYFPKFFSDDKMNALGELAMLFGVLGLYFFWQISKLSDHKQPSSLLLKLTLALVVGIHLIFLGFFTTWFTWETWPGNMPPISLLSFLLIIAITYCYLRKSRIEK